MDSLRFCWKAFDSQLTWCQSDSYSLRFDLNGIKPWTSIRKRVVLSTSIIHPQKIKKHYIVNLQIYQEVVHIHSMISSRQHYNCDLKVPC